MTTDMLQYDGTQSHLVSLFYVYISLCPLVIHGQSQSSHLSPAVEIMEDL